LYFINAKNARQVMEGMVSEKMRFSWFANCRANMMASFDDDFMQLVYDSGCRSIFIGAESGSDRMLATMNKKIKAEQIVESVEKLNRFGIKTIVNFMSGFPGEERQDIEETINLVQKMEERFSSTLHFGGINVFAPYPGSELFHQAVREGYTPPRTFAAWGKFILNEKRPLPWTSKSHMDYIWKLAIVSRWEEQCSWGDIWKALKQGLYERAGAFLFAGVFRLRWRKRLFGMSLDVHVWSWILKHLVKVG